MPGEFWTFLALLFQTYGAPLLVCAAELIFIIYLLRLLKQRDAKQEESQNRILELSEKRLKDALSQRDNYEQLARNIENSIELLIKIFRKRNDSEFDD